MLLSWPVIHHILTSHEANVFVDIDCNIPRACIGNFNSALFTENSYASRSTRSMGGVGHVQRWSAPEVLSGDNVSKESDIYSFSMTIIEVRRS